ncbi:MAG: adenine-specific methyltransferase EcoRI family protein [Anaerolineaceae bacterium]|nr:adenine-specific methyltransferase EcoRI family protein [Anaerolineaceae bacterium]MDE0329091.1 adenine-specific methyltransferase EcoRI family protein [Anaerolineaceae bacterium]
MIATTATLARRVSAMAANRNLHSAKSSRKDEFYTQLSDIENELRHYTEHFRGKVVYCNCDDPRVSNFFKYFSLNFARLGLKKLITTCYKNQQMDMFSKHDAEKAIYLEYDGTVNENGVPSIEDIGIHPLQGDGDFRSDECIMLLKYADIVVTNPPFSLFREYVAQLMAYDKQFLIIGHQNAITYKEIFPLIKENRIWLGYGPMGKDMLFDVPEDYARYLVDNKNEGSAYRMVNGVVKGRLGNAAWYTNLDHNRRHEDLILYKKYTPEDYPTYDNYDAIEVSKTKEIPCDYAGAMGVPISFLDKHNPEQFEIVSANDIRLNDRVPIKKHGLIKDKDGTINGKPKYVRIVIRNKRL